MKFHAVLMLCLAAIAVRAFGAAPPPFPAGKTTDTYYGVVVDDPYRELENVNDPAAVAWMKAQSDHAWSTLEGLKGFGTLHKRIAELDDAVAARVDRVRRIPDGRLFFTRRGTRDNTFKLFVRGRDGRERLLVDPDEWQKQDGKPHAINYFVPSRDGRYVAVGVSEGGSEAASIYVLETATAKRVGTPIDRAQYPDISWAPDNRSFFFRREQKMEPGMPATERYQNGRVYWHRIGTDPEKDLLLLGPAVTPRVNVPRADFPAIVWVPGSRYAIALVVAGVQREISLYTAPLASVGKPDTPWVKICDAADKVVDFAVHGDDLYLRTYRGSPRYSIVRTRLSAPDLANAASVVPASEEVIFDIAAARDGLYYEARNGAVKGLKRLRWGAKAPETVELAVEGAADIMTAAPDIDGAIVGLSAWTRARQIYAIDARGGVKNTGLQPLGKFDAPADLVATEVKVKSWDGAMVPLSILHRKDVKLDGNNPTLLYGYGAYGITEEPSFLATRLAWLERGGVFAVANVRGSGVYGEDWYKAGYKATKPNTWKDFIACGEYLVAQKYTTSAKLGILGGSAGGILVGRAMTDRPDLFGAVVSLVGVDDTLRAETTANGIPNIPEFGSVKTEEGFRALYEMSSYAHVKAGTKYPAVLFLAGVNDPRVNVWQSSKMAARLQAATTSGKPVLLALDYESGHGIGDTKAQRQKRAAAYYSFLFWQAGDPDFQPSP